MAEIPVKDEEISKESEETSDESGESYDESGESYDESEETTNEGDEFSEESENQSEKDDEISEESKEMLRQMLIETMYYKDNIGKYVNVKTVDSEEHQGWLNCIDPMSGNFFLMTVDEDFSRITGYTLIIKETCIDMEVQREPDDETKEKLKNLEISMNLNDRKNQLVELIKKHRLPVVERDDKCLVVCDDVVISPPYNASNCESPRQNTLKNMQKIILQLPPVC